MNHWYMNEILDGLTKLMSLGLDRAPASDLVQVTAATWIEATTFERAWDQERDTPRIRAAFANLQRMRETWPAPRHFLEVLPPSSQPTLPGSGEKPHDPPELLAAMEATKRGDPMPETALSGVSRGGSRRGYLDEAERHVAQHHNQANAKPHKAAA